MKRFVLSIICLLSCATSVAQCRYSLAERKSIAEKIKHDTLPYDVIRLPEQINSPFSEFNPLLLSDSIFFFSSMRSEVDDDNELFFETHWSSKIYQADYKQGNYLNVKTLPSSINKSKYYHPNFCFNRAQDYMVFSRCYRTVNDELVCDLFESQKQKGKWNKPQILGSGINGKNFSSTQPFLAELEDYMVLYFVSNRPNGQGDMDIWFSVYKNGVYEVPINAGSGVNTAGNEVSPFYDVNTNTLYFSSDEWPGIGGYDIFYSQGGLCSWATPINMGVPFNSLENDIYFSVNQDGKTGYFSSNRPIDEAHWEDTCCNDIYRWELVQSKQDTVTPQDTSLMLIKQIFPISLYFDNDQPNPKTVSDTSTDCYMDLRLTYAQQKEHYLAQTASSVEKKWMETFFDDTLSACENKVKDLLTFLEERLSQGHNITLSIEGHASSLHSSAYNRHLSQRRIVSLLNELKVYNGGVLCPFVEQKQLIIKELPYGSSRAETIQGDAVHGRHAILQRKIIVWDIEMN